MTARETEQVDLTIDGRKVSVPGGSTLLDATRSLGIDTPTLCYLETLTPVNVCRVCVVELEGSRALVPSCSRKAEPGMVVHTASERVRHSRRLVLELLASSVDLSLGSPELKRWISEYGARPERFGAAAPGACPRDETHTGKHTPCAPGRAETVAQPVKIDNELYARDYSRCILCYKCVSACGTDAQNTFAIAVAGRGFDARISTEFDLPLGDSACVYCGNCIGVCPTGALQPRTELDLRREGRWDESRQTVTETICPYCGVGCALELRVQDNKIVKVTSPLESSVTSGNLCIKGRFGWKFVQNLPEETAREPGPGASPGAGAPPVKSP